jgi:hypothetical protein
VITVQAAVQGFQVVVEAHHAGEVGLLVVGLAEVGAGLLDLGAIMGAHLMEIVQEFEQDAGDGLGGGQVHEGVLGSRSPRGVEVGLDLLAQGVSGHGASSAGWIEKCSS